MFKILWKSFLASPALLATALVISPAANAAEDATKNEFNFKAAMPLEIAQASPDATLDQLENYSNEGQGASNSEDQLTSVNELKDVAPTEWAYEALRSLVERYGCIVGYPDGTFRGNRAMTRWEFAAGLNACMNTMERLIQENVAVLKEDVDKLKRLMQEFEAELAALGARVDNLEGRVSFLEDNQFSTTTKLQGEAIFAISDTFGDGDDTQTIFADRVRLTLNTSFDGEDRLVTRLAAGNSEAFETSVDVGGGNSISTDGPSPTTTQTFNLSPGGGNDVFVDWLAYYKPISIGEDFTINTYTAAVGGIWSDIAPTSNPFFEDYDGGNGALSTFASENPIYRIGGGSGIALNADLGIVQLTAGYLAGGANDPNEGRGLFNGDYAALAQVNFSPFEQLELGLTYVHAFHKAGNPIFGFGGATPVVGTSLSNNVINGVDRVTNSYGAQLAWRFLDNVSFSAFATYGDIQDAGVADVFASEYWTYGGGFAVADLGKEGSVLGIFAGVQPYLGDGGRPQASGNNRNPIHVEAFYKYQLTDNISITPGVIWLSDPEQTNGSNDSIIGTIRTTFTF
ncbi:iron uptake porin [Candidatus Gracilibacteria bacterium]|nr:iron uptake porin [Candidatus Gracilibacteria bacterium]NJM86419.1 iron uptake porin [Hydrococcus sp. RU_2_2]NJP19571.1 iron uptake porin [Hydrococcus sp. CRU_1_1]NJQ98062.1 iron uptake porin [Hydrococcus sp. CSU_1_8]